MEKLDEEKRSVRKCALNKFVKYAELICEQVGVALQAQACVRISQSFVWENVSAV